MSKEPSAIVGAIVAIVSAVLVFLQSFGVDITDSQQDAIRGLVAVIAPLVAGLIIRQFVWAPDTVKEEVAQAKVETIESLSTPTVLYHGGN